jgi:hypothetical protein
LKSDRRTGGVAQVSEAEFKPQYNLKKKVEKVLTFKILNVLLNLEGM